MKRFMGMMPNEEIEKTVYYLKEKSEVITIDAGPNGWTIIYADFSTEYKDNELAGTEVNYQEALSTLHTHFDTEDLEEISAKEG